MNTVNRIVENKDILYNIPVTYKGNRYAPVQHGVVIDTIENYVQSQGLVIKKEQFLSASNGQQIIGKYTIGHPNIELKPMLAFKNSLDGSMSFGICSGSIVSICSNGCVFGDEFMFKRKHMGEAKSDILESIKLATDAIYKTLDQHIEVAQQLKDKILTKREISTLVGQLFIEDKIIQLEQLNIIKKELEIPTHTYYNPESAWDFYNYCTYALKDTHPQQWHKQHKQLGNFFIDNFKLELA